VPGRVPDAGAVLFETGNGTEPEADAGTDVPGMIVPATVVPDVTKEPDGVTGEPSVLLVLEEYGPERD